MKNSVKYYLYLDVRKTLKNGQHPICLVLNYNGRRKFFRIGESASKQYFKKAMNSQRGDAKRDRQKWEKYEKKAKDIINQIAVFTFDKFERRYFANGGNNLRGYFETKIADLIKKRRIGTSDTYKDAENSLFMFKPDLNFESIDPGLLESYEQWMEDRGRALTTIGIYLRNLRTLYNEAIRDSRISDSLYPFKDYSIPTGENKKKALNMSQLIALKGYEPLPHEKYYINLWWFSFYAAGMNLKDIINLKWSNIKDDRIEFIRQKTRKTRKSALKISIPIDNYIQEFLSKYGQPGGDYILALYNSIQDPVIRYYQVKQLNRKVNKYIRKAAQAVELDSDVTLYVARHTFASLLNEKAVPLSYLKEQLGHTDISTTQKYLASISKGKEREYRSYLKIG